MAGQFEQALNAILLEKLGCGTNMHQVHSIGIGNFLYHLPEYATALTALAPFDNSDLLQQPDDLLEKDYEAG